MALKTDPNFISRWLRTMITVYNLYIHKCRLLLSKRNYWLLVRCERVIWLSWASVCIYLNAAFEINSTIGKTTSKVNLIYWLKAARVIEHVSSSRFCAQDEFLKTEDVAFDQCILILYKNDSFITIKVLPFIFSSTEKQHLSEITNIFVSCEISKCVKRSRQHRLQQMNKWHIIS